MDEAIAQLLGKLQEEVAVQEETEEAVAPQVEAVRIAQTKYRYTQRQSSLEYSLAEIIQNLPADYKVNFKRVAVYQSGIPLASSGSSEAVLPLHTVTYPAQVRVEMSIQTPETVLQYEDAFPLLPSVGDFTRSVSFKNDRQYPESPQAFRETVIAELDLLKREMFDKRDANLNTAVELYEIQRQLNLR